jgi:hypothetical protein
MSKFATVDEITKAFPFQTIPKITGRPTYETIAAIHAKLKVNAASIPTPLGGGQHGHLGLVLPRNTYRTVANNTDFNRPNNPVSTRHSNPMPRKHALPKPTDSTKQTPRSSLSATIQTQP